MLLSYRRITLLKMKRNLMIMQNDFFLQIMVLSMYMKYEAMSQNHVNDTNEPEVIYWIVNHVCKYF